MQESQEIWLWSLGWEDPLEEAMATHSSILAWRIPWTGETVHRVSKSQTRLKRLSMHTCWSLWGKCLVNWWSSPTSLPGWCWVRGRLPHCSEVGRCSRSLVIMFLLASKEAPGSARPLSPGCLHWSLSQWGEPCQGPWPLQLVPCCPAPLRSFSQAHLPEHLSIAAQLHRCPVGTEIVLGVCSL